MTGGQATSTPRTACVVVNYASADLVELNFEPLGTDNAVVVVDNLSGAAERERIARVADAHGWCLLPLPSNVGFGAGVNAGVAEAFRGGAEVICVLNPDASLRPQDLRTLAELAAQDRRALVAPRIVREDGRAWFTGARVDVRRGRTVRATLDADGAVDHPWLTGACLVFHRDAWALTGGFDPEYFMYWEDVDLSWRHVAAGGTLRYVGGVTVRHAVSATQRDDRRLGRSTLYYHYNCRNRLLFAAKNLDRPTRLRWAAGTPRYSSEVLLRGGRRQFLRPWRPLSAALGGSWRGLVAVLREI